ncbi:MAG: hypothetical protein WBE45_12590 [Terriglobales bacterium]|jgi:hypothetical protein
MKNVTVRVPENLTLEQCQRVLASVLNKAGHPACYSGFNISFENAVDPAETIMLVERGSQKLIEVGG